MIKDDHILDIKHKNYWTSNPSEKTTNLIRVRGVLGGMYFVAASDRLYIEIDDTKPCMNKVAKVLFW